MKIKQTLTRFYVNDMDQAIRFYEKLLDEKCSSRFFYAQVGLELAVISNILLISGSESALKPYIGTQATFLVDSLVEFKEMLLNNGAKIIRDLQNVPTGINMTVKHLDGTIIEYVEHKANIQM